jgi:hypothetical protein
MGPGLTFEKILIYGFVFIFCAIGAGLIIGAINTYQSGEPENALLMLIAALAFGGFGVGVLALTTVGFRSQAREATLRETHPDEPWLWREDWAAGNVRNAERSTAWFFWGFAILWNLISTPLAYFLPEEILEKENYAALFGLLFPLVGIGLIVFAIRKTVQRRKYGDCVFHMERVPGTLGGDVNGIIRFPRGVQGAETVNVRLSCIHMIRQRSGKSTSTSEDVRWQSDLSVARLSPTGEGASQSAVVRFRIPYDASPTGEIDENSWIVWKLEANAAVPGVDFATSFEIPVFKTLASSPQITEERLRSEEVAVNTSTLLPVDNAVVTIVPGSSGGTEFILKSRDGMTGSVSTVVIALVVGGIAVILAYAGAPVIFALVFGLFGVLVGFAFLFGAFGESRIIVADGHVSIRNSLFGIMTGKRLLCSSITKIGVTGSAQSGKAGNYSITFTQADGKTTSPLQFVKKRREADWLAEEVRKAMEPFRTSASG